MILVREELRAGDLDELGPGRELLEHAPRLRDGEERIGAPPDAAHRGTDAGVRSVERVEEAEVEAADQRHLRRGDASRGEERPHEPAAKLAVDVGGVGEAAAEAEERA